jgi:hypothetical protein
MAARQCPSCGARVPAGRVVADSYDLVCATCQHRLGISDLSRNLAALAGLVAGAIAWWLVTLRFASQAGALGWVWPVFLAYVAASVVAALALMLAANLELRTDSPAAESHAVAPQVPHH